MKNSVRFSVVLLFYIALFLIFPKSSLAALSACSASINASYMDMSSTSDVVFHINNNDSNSGKILWANIISPSSSFTIEGYGSSQPFSGLDVDAGSSTDLTIAVDAGSTPVSSQDWIVQVSDDPDGGGSINCTGSLGMSIIDPSSYSAPEISSVTISNVSNSSATISFNTDAEAVGEMEYGLTDNYGELKTGSSSTSHAFNLTSLQANTTYHFMVRATNLGRSTETNDQTFTTSLTSVVTTTVQTVTVTNTTTNTVTRTITPTPTPTPLPDRIPPSVSVAIDFRKPFEKPPEISGKASDNKDISSIDYSIDDGKNWLPVDTINSVGQKATTFSFTPAIFEDGNYSLKIRAKDSAENIGKSSTYILIIDRLPPQIGGIIYSVGPQILIPDEKGIIFVLSKMNQKITLSAVGGPTRVDISTGIKSSSLVKNSDSGLWSGVLNFDEPGAYELTSKAIDGAGNRTGRKLNIIVALNSGKVMSGISSVTSGSVTLWYFDNQTQRFVVWDGKAYEESNPQKITEKGEYGFFAPSGKYYLEVKSAGFKTLKTEIFTLKASAPITPQLNLEESYEIHLGPLVFTLPDFSVSTQSISVSLPVVSLEEDSSSNIIGRNFPNVDIFLNNKQVPSISFRSKPSIFIFLSTWSPYISQQLKFLNEFSSGSPEVNMVPIISQESLTSIIVFGKRGEYSFPIYSDPDGLLVKPLNLSFLPTTVFVDRKGTVRNVKVGILTKEELLDNVIN
jgi:hypothetical protein